MAYLYPEAGQKYPDVKQVLRDLGGVEQEDFVLDFSWDRYPYAAVADPLFDKWRDSLDIEGDTGGDADEPPASPAGDGPDGESTSDAPGSDDGTGAGDQRTPGNGAESRGNPEPPSADGGDTPTKAEDETTAEQSTSDSATPDSGGDEPAKDDAEKDTADATSESDASAAPGSSESGDKPATGGSKRSRSGRRP